MKIKKSKLWILCLTVIMAMLINVVPVSAAEIELDFDEDITSYSRNMDFSKISPNSCTIDDLGIAHVNVTYTAADALQPGDVVNFKLYYRAYCDNHEGDHSWTDASDGYVIVYAGNNQMGAIYVQDRGSETKEFTYVVPEGGAKDLILDYCVDIGYIAHQCTVKTYDFTINGKSVDFNY